MYRSYNVRKAGRNEMFGLGKRSACQAVGTAALFLFFLCLPGVIVSAAEDPPQKGLQGSYGEKKEIATSEDAQKALSKYFSKRDVIIGEIIEKELYFEAEIKDKKGSVIDKMIVDKRTGRIRSIY
jgi:hypothetical protein